MIPRCSTGASSPTASARRPTCAPPSIAVPDERHALRRRHHRPHDRAGSDDRRSVPADARPAQRPERARRASRSPTRSASPTTSSARPSPASAASSAASPGRARSDGITIIDDYGHHPVEIARGARRPRAPSTAARSSPSSSRTATPGCTTCSTDFCTCFNDADAVIVADVYAAGEAPIDGIDRDALVEGLRAHGHRQVLAARRAADDLARIVARARRARRHRRLPRRRQHHPLGARAAGRADARCDAARGGRADDGRAQRTHRADRPAAAGARPLRRERAARADHLVPRRRAGGGDVPPGRRATTSAPSSPASRPTCR